MEQQETIKPILQLHEPKTRLQKRIFQREFNYLHKNILKYELAFETYLFSPEYDETKYREMLKEMNKYYMAFCESIKFKKFRILLPNPIYLTEKYKPIEK